MRVVRVHGVGRNGRDLECWGGDLPRNTGSRDDMPVAARAIGRQSNDYVFTRTHHARERIARVARNRGLVDTSMAGPWNRRRGAPESVARLGVMRRHGIGPPPRRIRVIRGKSRFRYLRRDRPKCGRLAPFGPISDAQWSIDAHNVRQGRCRWRRLDRNAVPFRAYVLAGLWPSGADPLPTCAGAVPLFRRPAKEMAARGPKPWRRICRDRHAQRCSPLTVPRLKFLSA